MKKLLLAFIFLSSFSGFAEAQTSRNPCYLDGNKSTNGIDNCAPVSNTNPLPVVVTAPSGGGTTLQSNASSGVAPTSNNLPTNGYGYLWNGLSWDQSSGLSVGTVGAPSTDVVTTQFPITPGSAGFPTAAIPITGNASGTTGAVVGTLAANATKTTYICGFHIDATGTGSIGPIVIANLITSNMTYQGTAGAANSPNQTFQPCIPANNTNTAITITTTANASATAVNVNSWGYQQ